MVGNAMGGISDRADEWNEEGRKGSLRVFTEAKATTFEWEMSKKKGKWGEWGISIWDVLKEEVTGGSEHFQKGGRPWVENWVGEKEVGVVENIGCQKVGNRGEGAKLKEGCDRLGVLNLFCKVLGGGSKSKGGRVEEAGAKAREPRGWPRRRVQSLSSEDGLLRRERAWRRLSGWEGMRVASMGWIEGMVRIFC
jgi:hypothetical protein